MSEPNSTHASALDARLRAALAGTYDLERELGGGGMSRVFVAREVALDRRVVVKVLPDVVTEGLSRDRFRREILLSATLQHPNIIGVIAAGDAAGVPYFVMPLVEGESLRARLVTEGRLSIPAAVAVLRDVARALAYAHEILPVLGALGHAYARAGRASEARAILTSLDRLAASDGVGPARAKVLLALGDAEGAVDALLRAAKAHDSFFASEPMASPMFGALRSHPRFAELLASVNLGDSPLAARATGSDRPR